MSDKKISELPVASAVNLSDVSILVSGGTNYQYTFTGLLQLIASSLNVGANISFGTTLPANVTGKNGDVFIKTNTGAFAQKTAGVWTIVYTLPTIGGVTNGAVLYGLGIPAGSLGNDNDTYINTGTGVFYKKTSGVWGQVFSMQTGPQGPQGTAGTDGTNGTNGYSLLSGTSIPSNTNTGVNGDFYLNTISYTLYGPKTAGIWGTGVSLIGLGIEPGGTIGQVLTKASNNDYDLTWTTPTVIDDNTVSLNKVYSSQKVSSIVSNEASAREAADEDLQSQIMGLQAFVNGDDIDLDTIKELANAIKADESALIALTTNKLNTGDVYNALDRVAAGKALDARQGKVLNDMITALSARSVPAGGTAGQVLAKVDGSDNNVEWVDAGMGGEAGLTFKKVLFGKSDGTIQQDSEFEYDISTHSVYKDAQIAPSDGGDIYFFGDSITNGLGASSGDLRYSTLVATALGLTLHNDGQNNTTLEKQTPINGNGGVNMVDRINTIPFKGATGKYLVFQYGTNDFLYGGINYNPTNFKLDYRLVLENALSKGWQGNDILIISPTYYRSTSYGSIGPGGQTLTSVNLQAFIAATLDISIEYGTRHLDAFDYSKNRGGDLNLFDNIHPNNAGHYLLSMGVLSKLIDTVYKNGQDLAVNGLSEFLNIIFKSHNILPDNANILGVDGAGNVGIVNCVKGGLRYNGTTTINQLIIGGDATLPIEGLGGEDLLLKQTSKIWGVFNGNPGYRNSIQMIDSSGHLTIKTSYPGAYIRLNTAGNTGLTVYNDGSGRIAGDFDIPQNKKFNSDFSSLVLSDGSYNTRIKNKYSSGYLVVECSNGVDNTSVNTIQVDAKGRVIFEKKNNTNIGGDLALSRLTINSSTEGFLMPRMTTAQRDGMCKLALIRPFDNPGKGSGYTTASVSIIGGGGTGATATAVIVGGQISSYIITNLGSGYTSAPTVSVIGDGTGALAVADIALNILYEGLQIYNLDTHKINIFNGTTWQQVVTENA